MEGFPAELWEAAKTASPFGTLLVLAVWWLERAGRTEERGERQKSQEKCDKMAERVLTGLNAATDAVRENTRAIHLIDRRHE